MRDSFRLGTIGGIRIGVNWTVVLIAWLIAWGLASQFLPSEVPGLGQTAYWVAGSSVAILFLGSLLAHELAHAVVARREGFEVEGLTLWLLGGIARLRGESASPGAEARVAAVGPLTSLVLAGAFLGLGRLLEAVTAPGLLVSSADWLGRVNLLLAVFNLLPGAPLDGGRVARALIWKLRGDRLGSVRAASALGRVLGYGLITIGCVELVVGSDLGGLWSIVLGVFLSSAASAERDQAELVDALQGIRVADSMTSEPARLPATLTADALLGSLADAGQTRSWLLVGIGGEPVGLLTLDDLRHVPRGAMRETRLQAVGTPLEALPSTTPGELLLDLLGRLEDTAVPRAVVRDDGRIVGIVTPEDIGRVVHWARVRSRAGISGGPPPGGTRSGDPAGHPTSA